MQLTRFGDYAVRGLIHLAIKDNGGLATLSEIAKDQYVPLSFLAKVMQALSKAGLVIAYRGKGGGFSLARRAEDITIKDVIEAVEGPIILNRCLIRNGECKSDLYCGAHPVWRDAQQAIVKVLEEYSVADLAKKQKEKLPK